MNQNEFLTDYFRPEDTVIVNAVQLQKTIQKLRKHEATIEALELKIEAYELKNSLLEDKLKKKKLYQPQKVDLKV